MRVLKRAHSTRPPCALDRAGRFVCNPTPEGTQPRIDLTEIAMAESRKHHITVTTRTQFIPEQSDESAERFVFAYTITITNTGQVAAQLISRHWIISDAHDKVQEVRGLGVVGEQPLLKPGEHFEYTSGTAIATPVGAMKGSYQMVAEDGSQFEAEVPEFILSVPRVLH